MPDRVAAPHHFAYLFERFPTFTQTFCVREVEAMWGMGLVFPVYSIRTPSAEPAQDCFSGTCGVEYLPERFDGILAGDAAFRRAARKGQEMLRCLWGDEQEKKRIYEAIWLEPRLREAGVRHLHVHFAGTAARTAFWLRKLFGFRYSITAHANDFFCDEPPERLTQIFDAAEVVVTVSDFSVRWLAEHFPAQAAKFSRVYNGIQVDRFPISTFPEGTPVIVSVGRYIEKKGFGTLIEACAHLGGRDWRCLLIGQGPMETELKERVARLGLGDKVIVTGPKCEGEIRAILAGARIFALPCQTASDGGRDNLPTVIMEAMAAGLPVVSTPVAAVPEMVVDGVTGFVTPEKDPVALSISLARLLDEPDLARSLGEAGRARCLDLFDLQRTSASLCQILRDHDAIASSRGQPVRIQRNAA